MRQSLNAKPVLDSECSACLVTGELSCAQVMIESEPDYYHAEQGTRAVQSFLGVLYFTFQDHLQDNCP